MAELQVQYIDPQELKPFADNPRHHSERNIQDIQRSIKKFGFTNPILVRQEDNMVVAGHGRLQSAQELGLDEVPVIYLDFSENDAKLYAITDNRTAETSEWDLVALDELVQSLELGEDELPDTGFYADELEEILAEVQEDVDPYADKDADAVPEEVEPISQAGDLWILGAHRVLCGDATRAEDVERLMDGQKADMVLTDPPYGVDYSSKNEFLNNYDDGQRIQKDIANDTESAEETVEMWRRYFRNVKKVLRSGANYYISFSGDKLLLLLLLLREDGIELPEKQILVWVKNNHVLGRSNYNYKHEFILYGWNGSHGHKHYGDFDTTVWEVDKPLKNDLHPTMKPIELLVRAIGHGAEKGMNVYDGFLGSGSTLIACEKIARQCYGLEIDPHYCDVIVQRYADFVESTQDITLVRDGQELSYESVNQP